MLRFKIDGKVSFKAMTGWVKMLHEGADRDRTHTRLVNSR